MNSNGVVFELNKREWFYIVDCENKEKREGMQSVKSNQQEVYGPFPNSLIANSHMSNCHFTTGCRLIYQEDLKRFFAEEWNDIQNKITYSRSHPKHSRPIEKARSFKIQTIL